MFFPHFVVLCDLLLNRRTATWNLFVLYYEETNYFGFFICKSFILFESRPLPTSANTTKAIWRNLLSIQNEAIALVAMRSRIYQLSEMTSQKFIVASNRGLLVIVSCGLLMLKGIIKLVLSVS